MKIIYKKNKNIKLFQKIYKIYLVNTEIENLKKSHYKNIKIFEIKYFLQKEKNLILIAIG